VWLRVAENMFNRNAIGVRAGYFVTWWTISP
jgi:hypothetical protein